MKRTTIYDCSIIEVPKVNDSAGNISIFGGLRNLPFVPERVFYIYDIPAGEARGALSHKECHHPVLIPQLSYLQVSYTKLLRELQILIKFNICERI